MDTPLTGENYSDIEKFKGKSKAYNLGLLLMFGSGGYYFGYYMGIWNPLGEKHLRQNLKLDEDYINIYYGLINVCFAIGAMLGCLLGSIIATKIGRVRLLLITDIFSIFVTIGYMFPYIWLLYIT